MSAGGLSYSALTNRGKVTLPSVESGLGSLNVLRDPPKSIMTRRKDKVGQTMDITQDIQDSNDRFSEAILQFPRGVNPAVGVSYSNYGNNGGARNTSSASNYLQARLPYRIGDNFRPPLLSQRDTLPLSRLPRVFFHQVTNPNYADYTKKLMCPGSEPKRAIIDQPLNASICSGMKCNWETPIIEPFEVKYAIQPHVRSSVGSGVSYMDITHQENKNPNRGILQDKEYYTVKSQLGSENISKENKIEDDKNFINKHVQDHVYHSVRPNISSQEVVRLDDFKEIVLERNIPNGIMNTNVSMKGYDSGKLDLSSRDYDLLEKPKFGEFTGVGNIPSIQRREYKNIISDKNNIHKKSTNNYQDRFSNK